MHIATLLFVWLLIMVTLLGGYSVIFAMTTSTEEAEQLNNTGLLLLKIGKGFIYFVIASAILSLALLGAKLLYVALLSA